MKAVLALVSILSGAQYASADCSRLKQFDTTLVPACDKSELNVKWPNYADQSTYYACSGVNNAVLMACPQEQYFSYTLQECGSCLAYSPPAPCSELKTAKTPTCIPISVAGDNHSPRPTQALPTPKYPPSTPGTVPPDVTPHVPSQPTNTTTTNAPTNQQPSTTTTDEEPSTPKHYITFPAPPGVTTVAPGVPLPPAIPPTPPHVVVFPPGQ